MGMAVMLITHELGVIAETAQRVVVMYAGKVVEEAPVAELFARSAPSLHAGPDPLDPAHRHRPRPQKQRLEAIPGMVPSLLDPPRRLPLRAALPATREPNASQRDAARCARSRPGHTSVALRRCA